MENGRDKEKLLFPLQSDTACESKPCHQRAKPDESTVISVDVSHISQLEMMSYASSVYRFIIN